MKVAEKTYREELERLKRDAGAVPNTPMMARAKISVLVTLNMQYERIMMDRRLECHPYDLLDALVRDARGALAAWSDVSFIEQAGEVLERGPATTEEEHRLLFQKLWPRFSEADYEERTLRIVARLRLNGLGEAFLKGRVCVDLGCGHGNFSRALLREGASAVCGVDFGEANIEYARRAQRSARVPPSRLEFRVESVYRISSPDAAFDFAVQNGVFHHLENEDAAYAEARRVLKRGAWMWIYTDGAGAMSMDLWKASVHILRGVPQDLILSHLEYLNIAPGKRYHLGDGLIACYRPTTWEELTRRLGDLGFGNFRRLKGGFPTDFDEETIRSDPYGREKFGEGDLRLLAQKL